RLLRLNAICTGLSSRIHGRPRVRPRSPAGDSTLMTSAPMSPRYIEQVGPAPTWEKSTTRTPSRLAFSNCGSLLDLDAHLLADLCPLGLIRAHDLLHGVGAQVAGFVAQLVELIAESL